MSRRFFLLPALLFPLMSFAPDEPPALQGAQSPLSECLQLYSQERTNQAGSGTLDFGRCKSCV